MIFEERVRLLKKLDYLIKRKFRGNSVDYAVELSISRSAFFRLLEYIRNEFDSPIYYNKINGYYEYSKHGIMFFGFLPVEFLTEQALKKVQGGSILYIQNNDEIKIFSRVSIGGTEGTYI